MKSIFKELAKRHILHKIFSDFLEISAMVISNSIDLRNYKRREERYLEIVKRYNKDEIRLFANALAELSIELDKPRDILGELLMELEEGNKIKGQYLTPYHICKLNAAIAFDEEKLNKDGLLIVNEPSVGGGALVIALVEIMREKGYNPQSQLKVVCSDLDLKAVHMSYIQLSLLGIPAKVMYANALNGKIFDTFKTPTWILRGY